MFCWVFFLYFFSKYVETLIPTKSQIVMDGLIKKERAVNTSLTYSDKVIKVTTVLKYPFFSITHASFLHRADTTATLAFI